MTSFQKSLDTLIEKEITNRINTIFDKLRDDDQIDIDEETLANVIKSVCASSKNRKKVKKPKDPNAPKNWTNAYFHFTKEKTPELLKEHPDMKVSDRSKLAGEMWKNMSDDDKKKYTDAANKDKTRYEKEIKKYKKSSKYTEFINSDEYIAWEKSTA